MIYMCSWVVWRCVLSECCSLWAPPSGVSSSEECRECLDHLRGEGPSLWLELPMLVDDAWWLYGLFIICIASNLASRYWAVPNSSWSFAASCKLSPFVKVADGKQESEPRLEWSLAVLPILCSCCCCRSLSSCSLLLLDSSFSLAISNSLAFCRVSLACWLGESDGLWWLETPKLP